MKKHLFVLTALVALLGVGLYAVTRLVPVVQASPATSPVLRMSGSGAYTTLAFMQGDLMGAVNVEASLEGFQTQPPTISGPAVGVSLSECDVVTQECIFASGQAPAPGLQIDTKKLTSATLPEVTVQVTPVDKSGIPTGSPFPVTVALSWTGVGAASTQFGVIQFRDGHTFKDTYHFNGTFRSATVSGSVSYSSPLLGSPVALTGADAVAAQLMSSGSMDVIIER